MNVISWFESRVGDLLRIIGVLLALQGVITQYFTGLGVENQIITGIFGGLGLIMMISGKYIDSQSFTAIQLGTLHTSALTQLPAVIHNYPPTDPVAHQSPPEQTTAAVLPVVDPPVTPTA